eukprot:841588-Pleurochrysis_carterae.AAC.1
MCGALITCSLYMKVIVYSIYIQGRLSQDLHVASSHWREDVLPNTTAATRCLNRVLKFVNSAFRSKCVLSFREASGTHTKTAGIQLGASGELAAPLILSLDARAPATRFSSVCGCRGREYDVKLRWPGPWLCWSG